MDARFRIRTREGEEFNPSTVEVFSELVSSGVVRPHDLVYDALTGEWAPANVHPMVRLFQDPLVLDPPDPEPSDPGPSGGGPSNGGSRAEEAAPGDAAPLDASTGATSAAGGPALDVPAENASDPEAFELSLVEPEAPDPEEEAQAFIAKMEEERLNDPETPALSQELPLVDAHTDTVAGIAPNAPAGSRPRLPTPEAPAHQDTFVPRQDGLELPEEEAWRVDADAIQGRRRERRRHRRRGWTPRWIHGAILAGAAAALALSVAWRPGAAVDSGRAGVAQAGEAPTLVRVVPVTEEQARAMAFETFLDGVDALGDEVGVGDVPSMWLEGLYLSDPAAYPQVRAYWERYLTYLDAARAAEVNLYREAYLTAATDAGLSGPVLSLRLASAQRDFAAAWGRRDALYERVEELARASLALDDMLLRMRGRVTFEPIRGRRLSADPVIEAAGADPEAQARLEASLDRVLSALRQPDGSALDRAGVRGWLVEGLKAMEGGG